MERSGCSVLNGLGLAERTEAEGERGSGKLRCGNLGLCFSQRWEAWTKRGLSA